MAETAGLFDHFCQRQGLPIHGVSLGRRADRSTWRIVFRAEATDSERAQEPDLVRDFDEAAERVLLVPALADDRLDGPVLGALVTVLAPRLSPARTPAQLRALLKTALRARL